jgi:SgrR family transcriptional regulator
VQLIEYYHRLQTELPEAGSGLAVTLEDLAGILYCSERNVKFILKKMTDQTWIRWKPGRGRGNRSELTLLMSSDELLEEEARRYITEGNVKAGMELINLPGVQASVKEQFFGWLSGYFGYQEVGDREKRLDTLRLPYYSPILTLDPAEMLYAKDLHLVRQIFDTLVRYDPKEKKILPHIAHYWESDRNGTVWTFYLRKGVRFHHGRELTADDAVFSMERLRKLGRTVTNGWLAEPLQQVTALSPYVLQVELTKTNYMFLHYVSAAGMSLLPRDVYGQGEVRIPVGTGPFRVSRLDDCICALDAFQDYFLERALLDRVELWTVPMDCRPVVDNHAGMDLSSITCGEEIVLEPDGTDYKIITKLEQGCALMAFNMKIDGPHQNRAFREAVHLMIDRAAMARETGMGDLYPAQGFLPQDPPLLIDPNYDPEAAVQMLRNSGYRGEPINLMLTNKHKGRGEWIARQLGKAGIRVELEILDLQEASCLEKVKQAQCYLGGAVADEDLDLSLLEMYQVEHMPLRIYFSEELQEELDHRIDAILQEPIDSERPARIRELEGSLKRGSYVLFLLHPTCKTTFSSSVNGVSLNSLGLVNFKDLWFQPSRG